jgi:hypothetical protein
MDVNKVRKSADGLARNRLGTKAHFITKGSPLASSKKKTSTLIAINTKVTTGIVLLALSSSPTGSINFSLVLLTA